jgi:tRNA nucleotidyltransferase/poly(A) polymerase
MGRAQDRRAFALDVVETLVEAGHEAVWAGGCVRDLLLDEGHEPDDYDIATDALPERVREVFGRHRTYAVGAAFGVVLVRSNPPQPPQPPQPPIEVATFRTEGDYADGRHPDSVQFATRQDDARRRDFTINGMFMDPRTGEVFDDVGGRQDLERGVVRAIGDPERRIAEDKLRMLRAIRFTASLGFTLDPATAAAIEAHAEEIVVVSAERIAGEWRRMLGHSSRTVAVSLAIETGLLSAVFPEIPARAQQVAVARIERLAEGAEAMVGLAVLLADTPDPSAVCHRLKLSNQETGLVSWLLAHRGRLSDASSQLASDLYPVLAHPSRDALLELVDAIEAADGRSGVDVAWCRELCERVSAAELDPEPLLSGDDLKAVGLSAGPLFKTLLDSVRSAQLNQDIRDRRQALVLVDKLVADLGATNEPDDSH